MKTLTPFQLVALIGALFAHFDTADAGYATFDQITDTISISGDTVLATATTYEAVIRPTSFGARGLIWNEWQGNAEDKQFGLAANGAIGGFTALTANSLSGGTSSLGGWHHYAFVFDGSQERLYIDGNLVASQNVNGNIPDGSSSLMVVGAVIRNAAQELYNSFLGDIDSLRISNTVRYSGTSFTPTLGDFTSDASTVLLYNFNQAAGTTVITDESGNGHTGTLGIGFTGATSPTFATTTIGEAVLSIAPAAAISWQSLSGNFYQPQVTGSLTTPDWSDFGLPLAGNGSLMRVFDTTGGASQKFYRVIITTSP